MSKQAAAQADTADQAGIEPAGAGGTGEAGKGESQPAGGSRTFSQEEVNNLLAAERKAERAKYAEFKQKADAYDALEAERDELKRAGERRDLVERVSKETGVPADIVGMLSGADEEELTAQAKRLPQAAQAPVASEGGKPAGVSASPKAAFVSDLFGN